MQISLLTSHNAIVLVKSGGPGHLGDAVWATPFGRCRLGDGTFGRRPTWATGHLGDEPFGRCGIWEMPFGRGNILSKVFYFLIFHFLAELFISSKFSL